MELKWMKWGNRNVPYNPAYGITLKFFNDISKRIHKKLSTKIVVTGEAGIGKTYMALDFAMMYDTKFTIDQLIFNHEQYMDLTLFLPANRFIVLDEPSYVIGKREWYNELNKILVQAIESDRFRVHPLIIPIINKKLLDKTIREHLIQYMIWVTDRGRGQVYRIQSSQFIDKVYYQFITDLVSLKPKIDLRECKRETCLSCKQFNLCDKSIWVQYERKRKDIQLQRYAQGKMDIELKRNRKLTFKGRVEKALKNKEELLDEDGNWDVTKIMLFNNCSDPYAYRIKKACIIEEKRKTRLKDKEEK